MPATVVSPHELSSAVKTVAPNHERSSEPEEDATVAKPLTIEDGMPPGVDDAAEAAFLADVRARGEVVVAKSVAEVEETNPKALPPLADLVNRIPTEVRDVLEELFRARFVTVKRFPKKALKTDQA